MIVARDMDMSQLREHEGHYVLSNPHFPELQIPHVDELYKEP
jgi:hypothetical protein